MNILRMPGLKTRCALYAGAALCILMLNGCAGDAAKAPDPNQAYTASDLPETRKRAGNRLQLATLYYQNGKSTFALDEIKQAILIDPGWYSLYWMRGLIQMQMSDNPAAEASFQKALSINPNALDLKHNYAILLCKTKRGEEGLRMFDAIIADPAYEQRAKSYLERGNCQLSMDLKAQALASFLKSYEFDAANPVTGYKLAQLLFEQHEDTRAQFYIRRINNSEASSAESLWLGIKVERRIGNMDTSAQLGLQLRKLFGTSPQALAYERGAFDE